MPILEKYRHYFDIDPDYFPAVNEAVILSNPEMWKKFFPHETFVRLIRNTVGMLDRRQKLSLWVEGAYGTGKSHAVLTLKKLLDASEAETGEYFEKYGWDVSPTELEWYRSHDDNIVIASVNWLYADESGEAWELMSQYRDGQISAAEMLASIDRKVQMMLLEGN